METKYGWGLTIAVSVFLCPFKKETAVNKTTTFIAKQHTFFFQFATILSSLNTRAFFLCNNNTIIQIWYQCPQLHTSHIQYIKKLVSDVISGIGLRVPHSLSLFACTTFGSVAGCGVTSCVFTWLYYTGSYLDPEFWTGRNWRPSSMAIRSSRWGLRTVSVPIWRQVKGQTFTIAFTILLCTPLKEAQNSGTKRSLGISSRAWMVAVSFLRSWCTARSRSVFGFLLSILMNLHKGEKHLENLTDIHRVFTTIVGNIDYYLQNK